MRITRILLYPVLLLAASSCGRGSFSAGCDAVVSCAEAGDYAGAAEAFAQVRGRLGQAPDSVKAGLYSAMGRVYAETFAYSKALEAQKMALSCAEASEDVTAYGAAMLDLTQMYIAQDSTDAAYGMLSAYESRVTPGWKPLRARYLLCKLGFLTATGAPADSVRSVIALYLDTDPDPDMMACAKGFYVAGDTSLVRSCLAAYAASDAETGGYPADYYYLLNLLDRAGGRFESAADNLAKYAEVREAAVLSAAVGDVALAEERAGGSLARRRLALTMTGLVACLVALAVALLCVLAGRRRKYEALRKEYLGIKGEFDSVRQDFEKVRQEASAGKDELAFGKSPLSSKEAKALVEKRLQSLSSVVSGSPQSTINDSIKALTKLSPDRGEFVETIGLLFAIYNVRFYSRLSSYGLSRYEIGYCCLYVLGYRTKELQDIVRRKDVYNISSAIRAKLGMTVHDSNLSHKIMEIYSEAL